jgi:putative ABC transport system ATP-binding protein
MDSIVEVRDLWKVYRTERVPVEAVRGIDLQVSPGEFAAILGPSGSGKSSLLHMLGAMDRPTRGDVRIEGKALAQMGEGERSALRARRIGFVFQAFNLMPILTAFGNVELALRLAGTPRGERRRRAETLLERVGLAERARHLPRDLSGGERQRVAVARALANRPALLLADEPTGNLDSKTGHAILALLDEFHKQDGQTILLVTHDLAAAGHADRVLVMRDGRFQSDHDLRGTVDRREALRHVVDAEL